MPPKWNKGYSAASRSGVGLHQWERQRRCRTELSSLLPPPSVPGPLVITCSPQSPTTPHEGFSQGCPIPCHHLFHLSVAFSESEAALIISSSLGLPYMAASLQRPCLLTFLPPNPRNHQLTHCVVLPAQHTEFFLHIKKTDTAILSQTFN